MNDTNFVNSMNFLVEQNKILLFYGKKHLTSDFFLNVMSFRALNFSNSEIFRALNFSNMAKRKNKLFHRDF